MRSMIGSSYLCASSTACTAGNGGQAERGQGRAPVLLGRVPQAREAPLTERQRPQSYNFRRFVPVYRNGPASAASGLMHRLATRVLYLEPSDQLILLFGLVPQLARHGCGGQVCAGTVPVRAIASVGTQLDQIGAGDGREATPTLLF